MKEALDIHADYLIQVIGEQFAITIQRLEFVPIGESGWFYKGIDTEGRPLAVKVQKNRNPAVDEVRRLLADSQYPSAPTIHLTVDGMSQTMMNRLYISVEEYVDHSRASTHDSKPSKGYLLKLGKALRSLHDIAAPLSRETGSIPVETYQSLYLSSAQRSIAQFMNWSNNDPGTQEIKRIIDANKDTINDLYQRSVRIGAQLAAKRPRLMLTHGDVHFGNILEVGNGGLILVDWDSTMIAGSGHDFMYFSDSQLADISLGYGADVLEDKDNLQYYRNHLMLRFIWFWLNKAMASTTDQGLQSVTETIATTFDNSPYLLRALGRSD